MREHKYRGINNFGEWVYGSYVCPKNIHHAIYFEVGEGSYKEIDWQTVDPKTVGQFTGLKDPNGKDIYEGDILRYTESGYQQPTIRDHGVVSFSDGQWIATWSDGDVSELYDTEIDQIIGNIHQNPELLKEAQNEKQTKTKIN